MKKPPFTWIGIISIVIFLVLLSFPHISSLEGLETSSPFLFWLTVSGLALADSVNPCMISLMIIMLANLVALGLERKGLILKSSLFTIVVYITYLMLGLLIFLGYSYLYAFSISVHGFNILKILLISVLVIAGLINLRDALKAGKATFAVPEFAKEHIQSLLTYVSIIATILLAVFVTIIELPCTGIFYLGLIAFLHSAIKNFASAIFVLAYYNLLFVLPEIVITLFVWKGIEPKALYESYRKHRKIMRILEGIILIILAILVWFFVKVG